MGGAQEQHALSVIPGRDARRNRQVGDGARSRLGRIGVAPPYRHQQRRRPRALQVLVRREAQLLHRPVAAVVRLGHHRRGRRLQRRPHDRRRVHDLFGQRRRHPPGRVGQRGDLALDGIGIDLGLRGIVARPAGRRRQRRRGQHRDHQPRRQAAAADCPGYCCRSSAGHGGCSCKGRGRPRGRSSSGRRTCRCSQSGAPLRS